MLFSSITFLYYFLPVVLVIYYAVPEKWKNAVLFAVSFLFYVWGEPKYGILLLISVLLGYLGGRGIEYAHAKEKKEEEEESRNEQVKERVKCRKVIDNTNAVNENAGRILLACTAVILLFLVVFKYSDFLVENLNAVLEWIHAMEGNGTFGGIGFLDFCIPLPKLLLPLGISFYTFQIVSYLVDVYRGEVPAERNFISFGAYVTMFPQLVAGPIVRYSSIAEEMKNRHIDWTDLAMGSSRFACGLAKKVLIADQLSELVGKLSNAAGKGAPGYWMLAAAYVLQVYYDFSGYSDMAIGMGKMLGFTFPENFRYPLASKSITEFWRRWHITLSGWFRDYVYIPLGGSRVSVLRWFRNVLAVWGLSGLWHGASWNYVLWGLYFAMFLLLERGAREVCGKGKGHRKARVHGNVERCRKAGAHVYTLAVIIVSFVIFQYEDLKLVWENLDGMFTGGWTISETAIYEMKSYGVLFLIAVMGAFPIVPWTLRWMNSCKITCRVREILRPVVTLLFLGLVTAFLIGSSAHPFLYFRF